MVDTESSIGAGRGDNPSDDEGDGKVKCDTWGYSDGGRRELNYPTNTYYSLT